MNLEKQKKFLIQAAFYTAVAVLAYVGLIYFTDGYGIFPEHKPPYNYDTAFVFLEDDFEKPPTPPWAIKLVLPVEDLEENV